MLSSAVRTGRANRTRTDQRSTETRRHAAAAPSVFNRFSNKDNREKKVVHSYLNIASSCSGNQSILLRCELTGRPSLPSAGLRCSAQQAFKGQHTLNMNVSSAQVELGFHGEATVRLLHSP